MDAYENDLRVPLNPDANQRANRDFHYLMCTVKLKSTAFRFSRWSRISEPSRLSFRGSMEGSRKRIP